VLVMRFLKITGNLFIPESLSPLGSVIPPFWSINPHLITKNKFGYPIIKIIFFSIQNANEIFSQHCV